MYDLHPDTPTTRTALLGLTALMAFALAIRVAHADEQKPKQTPTEVVVLTFGKLETSYRVDGSKGPDVAVEGSLHVMSQALLAADGTPIGFTLHTNLSDAFGVSVDGAQSYAAVGASDGVPVECHPAACPPPAWTLTFRLVPEGLALRSSLLFDLTLVTQYASDGKLLKACLAGQDGCDTGGLIP